MEWAILKLLTKGNPSPRVLSSETNALGSKLAMDTGIFFNILWHYCLIHKINGLTLS